MDECWLAREKAHAERKLLKSRWKDLFGQKPPSKMTDTEMRGRIYSALSGKNVDDIMKLSTSQILMKCESRGEIEQEVTNEVQEIIKEVVVYNNSLIKIANNIKLTDGMIFPDGIYPVMKTKIKTKDTNYVLTTTGECLILDATKAGNPVVAIVSGNEHIAIGKNGYIRKTTGIKKGSYYPKELKAVLNCEKILLVSPEGKSEIINTEKLKPTDKFEKPGKKIFDEVLDASVAYDDSFILSVTENGYVTVISIDSKIKVKKEKLIFCKCIAGADNFIVITSKNILRTVKISQIPIDKKIKVRLEDGEKIVHAFVE